MYYLFSKQKKTSVKITTLAQYFDPKAQVQEETSESVAVFCGEFNSPVEMIEEIHKDPMAAWFCVEGVPQALKVAMPVMLDGKLLHSNPD
jgi:hypothetical protein